MLVFHSVVWLICMVWLWLILASQKQLVGKGIIYVLGKDLHTNNPHALTHSVAF